MYEVVIPLRVGLPADIGLGEAIDRATDELAAIDKRTPELLDYAVSSDAGARTAVFEITVEAPDGLEALNGAVSWVRAALHSTGGRTPGWEHEGVTKVIETYEVDLADGQVEVRQLLVDA
jgi:hypothetical protein